MSKVVASLPHKQIKNGVIGGGIALAVYILLQFPVALLVHREVLGEQMIYPFVCVSAALASFLGCGFSVWRGEKGKMLSAAAVIGVFLTLTAAIGILTSEVHAVGFGLTGVGISMAIGGLAAAVIGSLAENKGGGRYEKRARRRSFK